MSALDGRTKPCFVMQATGSGFMFIYDDDFVLRSQLLPQWSVAGFLTKTAVFHGSETDLHASRRYSMVK